MRVLLNSFVLALAVATSWRICSAQLTWTRIVPQSTTVPSVRFDMAVGYDPDKNDLYMFGGQGAQIYNDLWKFDLDLGANNSWTRVHGPQPDSAMTFPRQRFSIVAGFYPQTSGGLFLISTGEGNNRDFFNDIWAFNASFNTSDGWRQLPSAGDIPTERYGAAGGFHRNGTSFYLTHGFSSQRFSDTLRYDLQQNRWITVFGGTNEYAANEPHPRCLLGSTLAGPDQPVFFGGCLSGGMSGGPCPAVDSWAFRNSKWERLDDCPAARQYSAMAAWPFTDDTAVMFGGIETDRSIIMSDKSKSNEVDFVNTATGKWRRLGAQGVGGVGALPDLRQRHGMVAVRDGVLIFGGSSTVDGSSLNDLWLLTGNPDGAPEVGSCGPQWFLYMHLHGFFMIVSWGFMLTAGVFIARYFRHKDPLWFKIHRGLQITGACLSLLGIILVFPGTRALPNFAHGVIGILILIFSIQQIINGLLRPHKEKGVDPPKKRVYWEYWHLWGGRLFILLALINITLGVYLIIAPVAVIAIWFIIFVLWIVAFIIFEIRMRMASDKSE